MKRTATGTVRIQTNIKSVSDATVKARRKRLAAIPETIREIAEAANKSYSLARKYFGGFNSSPAIEAQLIRFERKADRSRNSNS